MAISQKTGSRSSVDAAALEDLGGEQRGAGVREEIEDACHPDFELARMIRSIAFDRLLGVTAETFSSIR